MSIYVSELAVRRWKYIEVLKLGNVPPRKMINSLYLCNVMFQCRSFFFQSYLSMLAGNENMGSPFFCISRDGLRVFRQVCTYNKISLFYFISFYDRYIIASLTSQGQTHEISSISLFLFVCRWFDPTYRVSSFIATNLDISMQTRTILIEYF